MLLSQLCPSLVLNPELCFILIFFYFLQQLVMKNLSVKLKELYSEHLSHHLDLSMNISPYLLYHISILSSPQPIIIYLEAF